MKIHASSLRPVPFAKNLFTKFGCVLVMLSLLSVSAPAAPVTIVAMTGQGWQDLRFTFLSSRLSTDLPQWVAAFLAPKGRGNNAPKTQRVEISPGSVTVVEGSQTVFTAIAYDIDNFPVNGAAIEWRVIDQSGRLPEIPLTGNVFDAAVPGTFTVTAESGGHRAEVTVNVVRGSVDEQKKKNAEKREVNSRNPRSETAPPKKNSGGSQEEEPVTASLLMDEGGWNDDNWGSGDDPGNTPGNPPGSPVDGGAGSGNFQFSAPVASLPGRGIDLALNLNYNSRLWNKSGSELTYDIDKGFPAPGWSLGFGKIAFMGTQGGCMIVDADGTRHGYTGTVTNWSTRTSFTGRTTDGTFIDYNCEVGYGGGGAVATAWVKMPNGTEIVYSSFTPTTDFIYPTKITDAQGNYVTITYQNNQGPAIANVADTMGRVVTLNYDSQNRLSSVQVPGFGTNGPRTALIINYQELTLNYSFAGGITTVVRDASPDVIKSIYYPSTNTGYWFGDGDSYSTYGMLVKVIEQRGMSYDPQTGVISAGQMTKQALYNYPLTAANVSGRTDGVGLTDAPTYETLSESWTGADVAGPAVTTYKVQQNATPRSTTVIQPNGAVSRQLSYNAPSQFNDGLVYSDETYVPDPAGTFSIPNVPGTFKRVAQSNVIWAAGNYDSPRPTLAEVYDENGHKVSTQYTYGTGKFNQITRSCDYDNASVLLRCAEAEYENSAAYIGQFNTSGNFTSGRHIFNLVKASEIENPDGSRASRTEYEYDNYQGNALTNAPGIVQHLATSNPYTTQTKNINYRCIQWEAPPGCNRRDCSECVEYTWDTVSVYEPASDKRGNITKVTTYADAQTLDPLTAVVETRGYDIAGNPVKSSSSCCEQTTVLYDDPGTPEIDTQYAYPVSQTHGAADPGSQLRMTTSSVYDFKTGLINQTTDANGLTSKSWYNPDTLRPIKSESSTGAYTEFSYDDTAMTVTEEIFEIPITGPPVTAGKNKKYLNGVGQVRKEESFAPNSIVDIVETKYTLFGEESKQSRPYRSGDTIQWSEKFYDNQRRLIKVVESDLSETKAFYNEAGTPSSTSNAPGNKMRVVDAWGRERWGRYDQQGRLVEVVEPDPDKSANPTGSLSASGNLLTKYSYDTLGRLIQTEQGSQFRKFKYDSLGRLTRQKLAEQTSTLSDLGNYVQAGQSGRVWSEAFEYDTRSNLIKKTDPRGVRTLFSYHLSGGGLDPLNRLQSRTFDTSGLIEPNLPIENYAGSSVSYEYMTAGDRTRIKKIRSSHILTEDYSYDSQARVSEYKQTIDGRENLPMTINYLYDTLDRVKEITYPDQYQLAGGSRKIVKHTYDTASRLESLTYGTVGSQTQQAGDINYNASDQTTQIRIGSGTNQVTEQYAFDPETGLLTGQTATMNGSTLLNLSYEYNRNNSVGSLNGKTGHLTRIIDNLNTNKNREYEFDALGRLTKAKGGATGTLWNQTYTYDRYGNRTNVTASGTAADSSPIPLDGIPNLSYDDATNRITTSGFEYDVAGNQIRGLAQDGTRSLTYEYDAANRISVVKKTSDGSYIQAFQYGSTNARLIDWDGATSLNSFYCSVGGTVLAEYIEYSGTFTWTKSYTYLGDTQLATITPSGGGAEFVEFNHPDRLGTRVKTDQSAGTSYEQSHLPFGTALNAESTLTDNNKRFTTYDRSPSTGLDYALNRTYDSKLGRFTQVDPIGMQAASLAAPQTLNMYSYCVNDPVNYTDPSGLFLGSFFKWLGRAIMSLFRSGVARRIAVRFVTSFIVSGGNLGVAFRSVLPDILAQLGLNPNLLLTPGFNPNLRYPVSFGVGSLSEYIIKNLGPKTVAFCRDLAPVIDAIRSIVDQIWAASNYGTENAREQSGKIAYSSGSGKYFGIPSRLRPNQSNVSAPKPIYSNDGNPRGTYARPGSGVYDLFDIHTHPFDTGQWVNITGDHRLSGTRQQVGDVTKPSPADRIFLDPRMIGLIVTKTSIAVYTKVGRRCLISR